MPTIGGKFTTAKRNLVTYIEEKQYETLRKLAALHGRSISAEAARAIENHLQAHHEKLGESEEE